MIFFAYYLLKVMVCSSLLYVYYRIALRNKIFHQWNRFYLLFAVILSLVLPLCNFTIDKVPEPYQPILLMPGAIQTADNFVVRIQRGPEPYVTPAQWAGYGYGLICILLFLSMMLMITRIMRILEHHPVQDLGAVRFVNTDEPGTPFSFFRYIFWNRKIDLHSQTGQQIFQHELVHVMEKHTLDKIFLQFVLSVFWCNPFFWIIRRELQTIHEFIADQKSARQHGPAALASMILQAAFPGQYNALTNPFFHSSIKRRILMLSKINNPRISYASRIFALPLLVLVGFAFTIKTKEVKSGSAHQSAQQFENRSHGITALPEVYRAVDTAPGKKEDSIRVINVNKSTNKVAITYKDGRTDTLPASEAMKRNTITNSGKGNEATIRTSGVHTDSVLIIVNGTIHPGNLSSLELDANNIQSINVIKGEQAVAKWGTRAKHGAIEITLKSYDEETGVKVPGMPVLTTSQLQTLSRIPRYQEYQILHYKVVAENRTNDLVELINQGPELSEKSKSLLAEVQPGNIITFENIKAMKDGKEIKLPSLVYSVAIQ